MKYLIAYDSQYGNTERIAQEMGEALSELGRAQVRRMDSISPEMLADVDTLFIGCPTQGWRSTPATQSFLHATPAGQLRHMRIACFDTRFQKPRWITGSAAKDIEKHLREEGISLSAAPESFFVAHEEGPLLSGELERAKTWAMGVAREMAAHPVG